MALPEQGSSAYIKALGDEFFADAHSRACAMAHTHVHSVYELYFCPTPISHRYNLCGRDFETAQPTLLLTRPYAIHSVFVPDPWPAGERWYVFSFGESTAAKAGMEPLLKELLSDRLGVLFSLTVPQAQYLQSILGLIFDPADPLSERDALAAFSFFLCRLDSLAEDSQTTGVADADGCVQPVMRYICENFASPLTVDALARQFSVSRSKLDRSFKAATGVTPKDFTELCRLHCAKKLLLSEKKGNISRIAQLCGFPSDNYFYRFFRQHTGMTPTQFKSAAARNSHI